MQLKSIRLEYFLKHEHLELEFSAGLNTIRGANEKGKSSFIEGLGYNLFGSAALEGTLEETLNWNAKSKSALKTFTEFDHMGSTFKCSRGDAGAELTRDTKIVCTGHKEVTAYIESMLGIPKGRAKDIVFANQNAIRGVLSLGPTAAADFIEKLADFGEVDKLIKRLSTSLTTGSTKALEEQLAIAETNAEACVIPEVPDHTQLLSELREQLRGLIESATASRSAHQAQKIKYDAAVAEQVRLNNVIVGAREKIASVSAKVTETEATLTARGQNEVALQGINDSLAEAARRRIYDSFLLQVKTRANAPIWQGDVSSFGIAQQKAQNDLRATQDKTVALTAQSNALLKSKVSAGKCPTCGTMIGDATAAAAHNVKVDTEVERIRLKVLTLGQEGKALQEELGQYQQISEMQTNLTAWVTTYTDYVDIDESGEIPGVLTWRGVIPSLISDETSLIKEAARLSQAIAQASDAASSIANLKFQQGQYEEILAEAEAALKQIEVIPPEARLIQDAEACEAASHKLQTQTRALEDEVAAAKVLADATTAERERLLSSVTALTKAISTQRADTIFLKAVKDARFLVAEKLWGVVMGGVSNYFSRLRGVPSVVVRTANGFAVDGKSSRPSGSTLDILGLALRIVVSKVFANCGLMVMDEPTAYCDRSRELNTLAMLQSAGFDQVIWVSHSDLSEEGAACLIEL